MISNRAMVLATILLCAVAACGDSEPADRAELTRREKDSIIARSPIPGARAVGTAMTSADSAAARQARLDSADQEP
ncbi:MAG TPA: hypothetical protein VNO75_08690 [Gemmatimonadaceae bacterium]|nr:hypothetical protein [Gemmatimonadaceae bacterium]